MVTQLHNTHIFELAKELQAERIREAQAAHLAAQQRRNRPAFLRDVPAWLNSFVVRWPVWLRTRSQGLA
jgi:hypothetical protein